MTDAVAVRQRIDDAIWEHAQAIRDAIASLDSVEKEERPKSKKATTEYTWGKKAFRIMVSNSKIEIVDEDHLRFVYGKRRKK